MFVTAKSQVHSRRVWVFGKIERRTQILQTEEHKDVFSGPLYIKKGNIFGGSEFWTFLY